jgi:hypothetical protein
VDQKGPTIDKSKPAKLRKRVDFQGNSNAFSAINSAKAMSVKLSGGVSLTVGNGARTVTTRFGADATISAIDVETFIAAARHALGDEAAEVLLRVDGLDFGSGHDLESFLQKLGIEPEAAEVEQ